MAEPRGEGRVQHRAAAQTRRSFRIGRVEQGTYLVAAEVADVCLCWPARGSTATTQRGRCWPRAEPSPADYGPMSAMIGRSPARHRRRRCSSNPAIESASIHAGTWRRMRASCRPTPMPGSMTSTLPDARQARSPRRLAGRMDAASSTGWPMSPRRRLPLRRRAGSTPSSPSSATSRGCPQRCGGRSGRCRLCRWSRHWRAGCAPSVRACARRGVCGCGATA